jgi:hypothetical protein
MRSAHSSWTINNDGAIKHTNLAPAMKSENRDVPIQPPLWRLLSGAWLPAYVRHSPTPA